jgi:hypothetical protein
MQYSHRVDIDFLSTTCRVHKYLFILSTIPPPTHTQFTRL